MLGVVLLLLTTTVVGKVRGTERPNVRLVGEAARRAVTRALDSAADRLARPDCAGLLGEFRDAKGRTLEEKLAELGLDAPDYLARVLFYDGYRNGRCAKKGVIALATPGNRVVQVCYGFHQRWLHEPELAEAILIHEAFHTLGLGENPPSSGEITGHVLDRCMNKGVTWVPPVAVDRTSR